MAKKLFFKNIFMENNSLIKEKIPEFKYTPEFMTSENLEEYATLITGMKNIKVKFANKNFTDTACVSSEQQIIYITKLNYYDQLDTDNFRITKALLCHECAHLLFPDEGFTDDFILENRGSKKYNAIYHLTVIADDLRVEKLMCMKYPELQEDFKFLADYFWQEDSIPFLAYMRKFGNYTDDHFGSLYWLIQKRYRYAELKSPPRTGKDLEFKPMSEMEKVFNNIFVPLLDEFITTREPARNIGIRMFDILIKNFPEIKKLLD